MSKDKRRLPGSEKLTRPEEISALSKYLGNIKKVQENHTTLNPDNLEVPGRTTGWIPNIEGLPGTKQHLDVEDKVALDETKINLEDKRDLESLSEFRENLENPKTIDTLDDTKLELENTDLGTTLEETRVGLEISTDIDTLGETRLDLEDGRKNTLEETRFDLEDTRENTLSDKKLTLEDSREDTLEETRLDIEDARENVLDENILRLEDSRENSLSDTKLELGDAETETGLEDTKKTLEVNKEGFLDDTKLDLEDDREVTLEDTRVDVEDINEVGLGTTKESLEIVEKITKLEETKTNLDNIEELESLEEIKLTLEDKRDLTLEDKQLDLEVSKEILLEDTIIDLETDKEATLDNTKLDLEVVEDIKLGDIKLDIEDTRENVLDETRLDLEDNIKISELSTEKLILDNTNNSVSLSENKIQLENVEKDINLQNDIKNLEVVEDIKLDDTKLDLKDERENNLEETIVNLEDSRENTLGETRLEIEDTRENNLEDTKLSIEDGRKNTLEETRLDIEDGRKNTLEDTRLDLEDTRENTLRETRLDLEDGRESVLGETRLDIEDSRENTLSDTKLGIEDSRENSLGETRLVLEDTRENVLEDTKLDIEDSRENTLSDKKLTLEDSRENVLEDTKLNIEDLRETELDSFLDTITDDRDIKLGSTIISGLEKPELESLYDAVLGMPETSTSDARDDGNASEWDDSLEDITIERPGDTLSGWDNELENVKISTPETSTSDARDDGSPVGWGESLYDFPLEMADDQKSEKILEMSSRLGPWGAKIASLVSTILATETVDASTATWFDGKLKEILAQMGIMESFNHILKERVDGSYNQKAQDLRDITDVNETSINQFQDRLDIPEEGEKPRSQQKPRKQIGESLETSGAIEMPTAIKENENGGYIYNKDLKYSPGDITEDRTDDTLLGHIIADMSNPEKHGSKDRGYRTLPKYQFPSGGLDALNINNFIRLGAERLFDLWDPRTVTERHLKTFLLDETIALLVLAREQLEKITKANRDRLPGDDMGLISDLMTGGVSGALDTVKDAALGVLGDIFGGAKGVDTTNPLNRPKTKLTGKGYLREQTTGFDRGNARTTASDLSYEEESKWKNLGKNLVNSLIGGLADKWGADRDISFKDMYINNSFGTVRTISELCELTNPRDVSNVETLFELIKQSPYITTPYKFGTLDSGRYGTMTLDTNAYWEVIIEPFCHTQMNGGFSFLPGIHEINIINRITHGVRTNYNKWIPISNFELQKSKLETKSIGLYSGDFSIPTVAELSNELRITVVDDSFKSWKNYFQKCMDAAVYSSEAHQSGYYKDGAGVDIKKIEDSNLDISLRFTHPTIVDKSRPIAALYKNVTFNIQIYIMTPQYSTIKKFNLLCILNSFEESASGDIDAGGYDLNLSFSIVGENPKPDTIAEKTKPPKKALDPKLGNYSPSSSKSSSLLKLL